MSGSEVQGCPLTNRWVSQHHLSFGHFYLYPLTAELLLSHVLGPLKCPFFWVVCLAWTVWRTKVPTVMTVTFLQAPEKVSTEGLWPQLHSSPTAAASGSLVLQQLCLQARCLSVLWGYLHLSLQCQIRDFTHQSFLSWSVIWAVITPLCSSGGLNEGEEGQIVFQQSKNIKLELQLQLEST